LPIGVAAISAGLNLLTPAPSEPGAAGAASGQGSFLDFISAYVSSLAEGTEAGTGEPPPQLLSGDGTAAAIGLAIPTVGAGGKRKGSAAADGEGDGDGAALTAPNGAAAAPALPIMVQLGAGDGGTGAGGTGAGGTSPEAVLPVGAATALASAADLGGKTGPGAPPSPPLPGAAPPAVTPDAASAGAATADGGKLLAALTAVAADPAGATTNTTTTTTTTVTPDPAAPARLYGAARPSAAKSRVDALAAGGETAKRIEAAGASVKVEAPLVTRAGVTSRSAIAAAAVDGAKAPGAADGTTAKAAADTGVKPSTDSAVAAGAKAIDGAASGGAKTAQDGTVPLALALGAARAEKGGGTAAVKEKAAAKEGPLPKDAPAPDAPEATAPKPVEAAAKPAPASPDDVAPKTAEAVPARPRDEPDAAADAAVDDAADHAPAAAPKAIEAAAAPKVEPTTQRLPTELLAAAVVRHHADGDKSFRIRLDPPELGRVDVKLQIGTDGEVRAHLIVERAETLDMMLRDQRGLERALEQGGMKLDQGGVQFSLRQDGQGQERRPERFEARAEPSAEVPADADPVAAIATYNRPARAGGLDLSV
jgi:flagellar hook-length control protein FliK